MPDILNRQIANAFDLLLRHLFQIEPIKEYSDLKAKILDCICIKQLQMGVMKVF
jgi:hypothetical protein